MCILCLLDCLLAFKDWDLVWPKIFEWLLMKSTVEQQQVKSRESRSRLITSFSNAGSFNTYIYSHLVKLAHLLSYYSAFVIFIW